MRSVTRKDELGEVFTTPKLCKRILSKLPWNIWKDQSRTWLDPTCGNGNFLVEIKARLLRHKHDELHILENMIFGADIMPDNVEECIKRLWGECEINELRGDKIPPDMQADGIIAVYTIKRPGEDWRLIKNIVCADGLVYDYSFGRKEENTTLPPEFFS